MVNGVVVAGYDDLITSSPRIRGFGDQELHLAGIDSYLRGSVAVVFLHLMGMHKASGFNS